MATDLFEIWQRYQKSKQYMDGKSILLKTEKNWQMYIGDQWAATNDSEGMEDLPMLNLIKPTINYKTSSISATQVTAVFSDMNYANSATADKMTALFDVSWEKSKMRKIGKKMLRSAAVQGDSYLFWGEGGDTRKVPQMLLNTQIHLGDENIQDIQQQPWIIIEERLSPEVVKERARLAGIGNEQVKEVLGDDDTSTSLYNKKEVKSKVLCLLYMEKDPKTGIVSACRCTKSFMIQKLKPVQQTKGGEYYGNGLTMYPLVQMVWEDVPNTARGVSEVEQLIPNQLELNKMLARRSISAKMTAFPRLAYDDASIDNPEDLDKVGAKIRLNGGNATAIANMIAYLAPQSMSPDAKQLCDELLSQTRTLAGASDAQLGNIDLSRVSGTAAQTIRDQQQIPLNQQQEMYQDFIENVALLWFELWKVYYPAGMIMDGIELMEGEIDNVVPNVRVDIAEDTSLSKMAMQQELMNLFNGGKLTFEEFVDAYPEHSSIPKEVLNRIVAKRNAQIQQGMMPIDESTGMPVQGLQLAGQGVNPGGASSGSYQNIQSMMAE